jgi:hypothetical protein
LRDSASSQVHAIAVGGILAFIVILAIAGRYAIAGIGPFQASATAVPDGTGLAVTLSVTNQGTSVGQTTCRVSDPADRTGSLGGFVLSPKIQPGATVTFTQHMTELGNTVRPLAADCSAP